MTMESSSQNSTKIENKHEALAGIFLAIASSDGEIADDEEKCICTSLSRMHLFQEWEEEQYDSMFQKLTNILNERGVQALLKMGIAAVPTELYETVFVIAADLVLSDRVVRREEKKIIHQLQQQLNIKQELVEKILEVVIIKNRG